jgi:hypothetical protein
MALWGTADSLYSVGTISVNYAAKTITGSGTSFTAAGISTGDVITIGAGGTFGSAVISGITSDTLISIATTQYLTGAAIAGVAYTLSERPVYTLEDSNYSSNVVGLTSTTPTHNVYGVDIYEAAALAPGNSGLATQYGGIHAGWVGIHTYIDMHGNLRVKSETLVAMSGITTNVNATFTAAGDANDDAVFPDRSITVAISASPSNVVGVGTTVTFTASATATPSASLSYQWQKSTTANGTTYNNIAAATGISTAITNATTGNNNYNYRVVVTADGGASATSDPIKLTVTA